MFIKKKKSNSTQKREIYFKNINCVLLISLTKQKIIRTYAHTQIIIILILRGIAMVLQ